MSLALVFEVKWKIKWKIQIGNKQLARQARSGTIVLYT